MLIKMLRTASYPERTLQTERTYDVEPELGASLVSQGHALNLQPPAAAETAKVDRQPPAATKIKPGSRVRPQVSTNPPSPKLTPTPPLPPQTAQE